MSAYDRERYAAQKRRAEEGLSRQRGRTTHVALRPRRCGRCDKPVLLDFNDRVLNDDAVSAHRCAS